MNSNMITVIGLGAMGKGIYKSLLRSDAVTKIIGYDLNQTVMDECYELALEKDKAVVVDTTTTTTNTNKVVVRMTMAQAVSDADIVVLVLVNEQQCQSVCFEGSECLMNTMKEGSVVILCSTVRATWTKQAAVSLSAKNIHLVDCPMSGGPVRAADGDLTLMVGCSIDDVLARVTPFLQAMGTIHFVGDVGKGSTVKMVHQLLAGVHICAAAEALALAAKAGVNVDQMYDIVNGAAGASWMFQDRGARMLLDPSQNLEVKSAMNIFVKDLDIVYSEAKAVYSPIPVASAALQQFISGVGMGLGNKDDSRVVEVYESVTGVPVCNSKSNSSKGDGGDNVGDFWCFEDGSEEEILEVADEPGHFLCLENEFTRVIKVKFAPGYVTKAHRHAEDSLYFFLVEGGLNVINHVKGSDPSCDCMEFGEVRFGTHKTEKPLVHKITNLSDKHMFCIDAEVIKTPPVTSPIPLVAEKHELIKTRDKVRVYKLILEPGEKVTVGYSFFYLKVVLKGSTVQTKLGSSSDGVGIIWKQDVFQGDIEWKEPCPSMTVSNIGDTTYEAYICEWR